MPNFQFGGSADGLSPPAAPLKPLWDLDEAIRGAFKLPSDPANPFNGTPSPLPDGWMYFTTPSGPTPTPPPATPPMWLADP